MARCKFVSLPEPKNPLDIELGPHDPWRYAADAKNWTERARAIDELLVDALATAVAGNRDVTACTGLALGKLTAACEEICDYEVRGPDSAAYYLLTTHAEWRAAAREFFLKNKLDPAEAIRARPGARLIHAIAFARSALATEKAVLQ